MRIYVGNLSYDATEDDLRQAFGAHGEVTDAVVVRDRASGRSRGFGFVEMADSSAGQAAIDALNNADILGRPVVVNEARPKTDRPPHARGARGSRGGHGDY